MQHAIEAAAARHADQIEKLIITDANDDPAKQAADIQDLVEREVDLLIVSPATAEALDPAVTRAMSRDIPVILVDRRVTSDNFVSFVTATDWALARFMAQWLAETLNFEGNIVMLPGLAGSSPAENRIKAAHEVFDKYPGIKILELQYTDWSPAKGKQVMSALIQKYGDQIDGVWSDHGLQGSGAIEAFVAAGYGKGEIPPNTCADLNACVKLAVEYDVPVINFDYPPAMGADSVDLALQVLAGNPVPKIYEVNVDVIVSKGHETTSIKADKWVEDYAQMDKPGELILSTGLGPTTIHRPSRSIIRSEPLRARGDGSAAVPGALSARGSPARTRRVLRIEGVTKRFPGVLSLDTVDFDVAAGEVHALVGENGAGKSTLIKVIAGAYQPDAGTIEFAGERRVWASPQAARAAGIHVIYQELVLFPELTVAENVMIGDAPRNPSRPDRPPRDAPARH